MVKSYSERGEDAFIESLGILPEKGFYLDLGCAWPCLMSNSAFLRDRRWGGLCIDGNPKYAESWAGIPEFHCAVLSGGEFAEFETGGVPELSRIGSGEKVKTRRLEEFLVDVPKIDFISCDLEGHEFLVLSTLNWNRYQPTIIISEHSTWSPAGIERDERVREMLEKMGYRVRHANEANYVFTK